MPFSFGPAAFIEGSRATNAVRTFTFTRSGGSENVASSYSVGFNFDGLTANGSTDFGGAQGSFTMSAGQTTATFNIIINEDLVVEPDETFRILIYEPADSSSVVFSTVLTILDDDGTATFSVTDIGGNEGSTVGGTTNFTFTVVRSGPNDGTSTVDYRVALGSAGSSDINGALPSGTLAFAPGETSRTVTVPVTADREAEPGETFSITLSNSTNAIIARATATATINDDDYAGSVAIDDRRVIEGNNDATVVLVPLTRFSGDAAFAVDFATSNGSAVAGEDYVAASGRVTFAVGQNTATIAVTLNGDNELEGDEIFFVTLSNAPPGVGIADGQAVVTIANDDQTSSGSGGATQVGSAGNDTFIINNPNDVIVEQVNGGRDTVYSDVSYTLPADAEVEVLSTRLNGALGLVNLTGNAFPQTIVGNYDNNRLTGGGGPDTLIGLRGNDSYVVTISSTAVIENSNEGSDTVSITVDYVLSANASVEILQVADPTSTRNINLTGSTTSQTITGNAGNNIINGFGGADTMIGLAGNDTYLVRGSGDQVIEGNGGGDDTVFTTVSYSLGVNEVERLSTVTQSDTTPIDLIGNFATQLVIGNYGNNVLNGGSGGIDTLIGLLGNDIYAVGDSRTAIIENAGEGADTVVVAVDYTLAAGVSVEVLAAQNRSFTTPLVLRGNEVAQTIVGNDGANTIDGGGGNDQLVGAGGADRFSFTTALGPNNVASIVDFDGSDRIQLSRTIFSGVGTSMSASAFATGSAATTADQRIIYNNSSGQLFYDADGSGAGAAVLFALFAPSTALAVSSFEMIG